MGIPAGSRAVRLCGPDLADPRDAAQLSFAVPFPRRTSGLPGTAFLSQKNALISAQHVGQEASYESDRSSG